jgi:alkanesulfonate monooxygenase SsuD/methylene tetrahydromethanopterin reductase-like flavin-dependent oxidoreductase (luciferase family)
MRFDYFFTMDNPGMKLPYDALLRSATEQTRFIEQAGFHTVWMGEHHFGGEGMEIHPNPLMTGTHLAAKTSRIRIGMAAIIIVYWHPLRVAEDIAMLDNLSEGRLELAIGRGLSSRESTNLNPDADRRNEARNWALFKETLAIMKKAWTEDPLTFEGEFYRFPQPGVQDTATWAPRDPRWRSETGEYIGMSIIPKPYQKPYPKLWNVLDKTPSFVECAELGLRPITWLRSREGLREALTTYQEALARIEGRPVALGENAAILRTTYVAESMAEARRIAEGPVETLYNYVGGLRSRDIYADPGEVLDEREAKGAWFDFLFDRDHLFVGHPEFVAERIVNLKQQFGLDEVLIYNWLPGLSHEEIMRSLELITEKVMPLVEKYEPKAQPAVTAGAPAR